MSFTKLFSSITESTIWDESSDIRIVWITMLAMSDQKGRVMTAIPGLAHRARVPVEVTRKAIEVFLGPDPDSRTPDHEGRRIEKIDGGYRLLNYGKYREKRDEEVRREANAKAQRESRERRSSEGKRAQQAEASRRYRARKKGGNVIASSPVMHDVIASSHDASSRHPHHPTVMHDAHDAKSENHVIKCHPASAQAEAEAEADNTDTEGTRGMQGGESAQAPQSPSAPGFVLEAEAPVKKAAPKARKKSDPITVMVPDSINTPEFREVWRKWEQHRKEIKHTLTPITVAQQFRKLEEMGAERAIAALNYSMTMGWQGIFEPDKGNGALGGKSNSGSRIHSQRSASDAPITEFQSHETI